MKININAGQQKLLANSLAMISSAACLLLVASMQSMPHTHQQSIIFGFLALLLIPLGYLALLALHPDGIGLSLFGAKVVLVTADAAGITLAATPTLQKQFNAWERISEVALARTFKRIYPSGHFKCKNVVVIFLKPEFEIPLHEDRVKLGVSVSGSGRQYLMSDFPDGNWQKFKSSAERYSPASVPVKEVSLMRFDIAGNLDATQ